MLNAIVHGGGGGGLRFKIIVTDIVLESQGARTTPACMPWGCVPLQLVPLPVPFVMILARALPPHTATLPWQQIPCHNTLANVKTTSGPNEETAVELTNCRPNGSHMISLYQLERSSVLVIRLRKCVRCLVRFLNTP